MKKGVLQDGSEQMEKDGICIWKGLWIALDEVMCSNRMPQIKLNK